MPLIAVLIIASTLAGAVSGALTTWLILRHQRKPQARPVPLADPALDAEIQRAAAEWADSQGRPEATGLMADKLHMLHRIGRSRGWWR